jgi:hypothetical protein
MAIALVGQYDGARRLLGLVCHSRKDLLVDFCDSAVLGTKTPIILKTLSNSEICDTQLLNYPLFVHVG